MHKSLSVNDSTAAFLELPSSCAKIKATLFPGATVPFYTSKTLIPTNCFLGVTHSVL